MLCIASNTCTASVVEICSSDAVITTVVLIYEIQEVGETFFVNTWTTVCWKIHPAKDRLGLTKSISLSFDADPFSQKVEGYV